MSNNGPRKIFHAGDFVEVENQGHMVKIIDSVQSDMAQLIDPMTGAKDMIRFPISQIKIFRTHTKLREFSGGMTGSNRKSHLDESQYGQIIQKLQSFIEDPLAFTPKEIIQFVRGKYYFYLWTIFRIRPSEEKDKKVIIETLEKQREFMLKFLSTVDFAHLNEKNIYTSSMSALCSCYPEMIEMTEISLGILPEFTEFKQWNMSLDEYGSYMMTAKKWFEDEFLSVVEKCQFESFNPAFMTNLMNSSMKAIKHFKLDPSQGLGHYFSQLFRCLKDKVDTQDTPPRQISIFYKYTNSIFTFLYECLMISPVLIAEKMDSVEIDKTQTLVPNGSEANKGINGHQNQTNGKLSKEQFIRKNEVQLKTLVAKSFLNTSKKQMALNELNFCMSQTLKDVRLNQKDMQKQELWPEAGLLFLTRLKKTDMLQKLLRMENFQGNLIPVKQLFLKLMPFLPKRVMQSCMKQGRTGLLKQLMMTKPLKDDLLAWLLQYIIDMQIASKLRMNSVDMLKYLDSFLKKKQGSHQETLRVGLIWKQIQIGLICEQKQFYLFENLFENTDNIKKTILTQHLQAQILPKCHNLLCPFNQHILAKSIASLTISPKIYARIMEPMWQKSNNSNKYHLRKKTIIGILHNAFKHIQREPQNYFKLLSTFIQYYTSKNNDRRNEENILLGKEDVFPSSLTISQNNNKQLFFDLVTVDNCQKFIYQLLPLQNVFDLKLFQLFFIKINVDKGKAKLMEVRVEAKQYLDEPDYFDEVLESLFYLSQYEKYEQIEFIKLMFEAFQKKELYEHCWIKLQKIQISKQCKDKSISLLLRSLKARHTPPQAEQKISYKLEFFNKTLQLTYQDKIEAYSDSKYRTVIAENDTNLQTDTNIDENDTMREIRRKLAWKSKRQPGEIIIIDKEGEEFPAEKLNFSFKLVVLRFIDREELTTAMKSSKHTCIKINYCTSSESSRMHQVLLDQAEKLLHLIPHSSFELAGIDFLTEEWSSFDIHGNIAQTFEDLLRSEDESVVNQDLFQNILVKRWLLDYFLWIKKPELLKTFNIKRLLKMAVKLEKAEQYNNLEKPLEMMMINFKILELLRCSGQFKAEYRQDVHQSSFDWGYVSSQAGRVLNLTNLVFQMLEGEAQGALNFCFQNDMIDSMTFSDAFWERFLVYWKDLFAKAGVSEKMLIFNDIEQRMVKNTQNMKLLGQIMQTQIEVYDQFELFESVLDRMSRQAFELRAVRLSEHEEFVLLALLTNCESLVAKKIECKFLQSEQFCTFLLSIFYDLTFQIPDKAYKLLQYSMINDQNNAKIIHFIQQQINEPSWEKQSRLNFSQRLNQKKSKYVGLINSQSTCYALSLFQQLFHNKAFQQQLFASNWNKKDNQHQDVLLQLKIIFLHMKQSKIPFQNKTFFEKAFLQIDGQPVGIIEHKDTDEFKNRLFDILEEYLPENMFWKKLFQGKQNNHIQCGECGNVSTTQETFNSICLTVDGIQSLEKSLEDLRKPIILEKDNAYLCQKCNKKVKASKSSEVTELPPHLTFVLKRFGYNSTTHSRQKIHTHFQFPLNEFDWGNDTKYKLKGVISHYGNPDSGHYTSEVKIDGEWYEFNDTHVRQIDETFVKKNTFGPPHSKNPNRQMTRTAYVLFYDKVEESKKEEMEIEVQMIGLQKQLGNLKVLQNAKKKQVAFCSRFYFDFILNLNTYSESPESLKLLYKSLIQIKFKLKEDRFPWRIKHADNILKSMDILYKNRNYCQFISSDENLQKSLLFLGLSVPMEFKQFVSSLIINNCRSQSAIKTILRYCLGEIYNTGSNTSIYYVLMDEYNRCFQWVGSYLHQKRIVGRIFDLTLQHLGRFIREQFQESCGKDIRCQRIGEKMYVISDDLKYHLWRLLFNIVDRFGHELHPVEEKYLQLQMEQRSVISFLFTKCETLISIRYFSDYLCWLMTKRGNEDFFKKVLTHLKQVILTAPNAEANRKNLYIFKRVLDIDDELSEFRCKNATPIWLTIFNRFKPSFFNDNIFDIIWLWFLKMAGSSPIFRNKIRDNKALFDFLLTTNYNNQGFIRSEARSGVIYSKHRLYNIPIPFKPQSAVRFHKKKLQKTKAILYDLPYDYSEDQQMKLLPQVNLKANLTIFYFDEGENSFEKSAYKWIFGDLIAWKQEGAIQIFPATYFQNVGCQNLTIINYTQEYDQLYEGTNSSGSQLSSDPKTQKKEDHEDKSKSNHKSGST